MSEPAPTPTDAAATSQGGSQTEATSVEQLPQWAQTQISDLRSEAAAHRVGKNEAVDNAKRELTESLNAEWQGKVAAAEAETQTVRNDLDTSKAENLRLKVAIDAKIPTDKLVSFAGLLKGDSEDELKSHAEELKSLFGKTTEPDDPIDPSQGSGNHIPLNGDPILAALKAKVGVK